MPTARAFKLATNPIDSKALSIYDRNEPFADGLQSKEVAPASSFLQGDNNNDGDIKKKKKMMKKNSQIY